MNAARTSAVVLAGLIVAGCSAEAEPQAAPPRTVQVVEAQTQSFERSVSQVGEIRPRYDTALGFRSGGLLAMRLHVGDTVRAGDVVATLDRRPAENDVRAAEAELSAANADLSHATLSFSRQRALMERNTTTRAVLEDAEARLATTRARVDAAVVALERARDALSYTELRAPHEGTVSSVESNQGAVVAAGETVLRLVTQDRRQAVFDVPEVLYRTAPEAAAIRLQLVTDPSVTATGTVDEAAPMADPSTRSYEVKVGVGANALLMPFGAPVVGTLVLARDELTRLPASALTTSGDGSAVFVVDAEDGTVRRRPVQVSRYDERFLFVSAGLEDGERVATSGVAKLRDGERVGILEGAR